MAANVNLRGAGTPPEVSFFEQNFPKIAFTVSTIALTILSPLSLFFGSLAGFLLHYSFQPGLRLKADSKIVTLSHTVLAIVGAAATLVELLPGGASPGFIFQTIPLICSMSCGSALYRTINSY